MLVLRRPYFSEHMTYPIAALVPVDGMSMATVGAAAIAEGTITWARARARASDDTTEEQEVSLALGGTATVGDFTQGTKITIRAKAAMLLPRS